MFQNKRWSLIPLPLGTVCTKWLASKERNKEREKRVIYSERNLEDTTWGKRWRLMSPAYVVIRCPLSEEKGTPKWPCYSSAPKSITPVETGEKIRQTQTEGHPTSYLASTLLKCHGHEKQAKTKKPL